MEQADGSCNLWIHVKKPKHSKDVYKTNARTDGRTKFLVCHNSHCGCFAYLTFVDPESYLGI
jgi:hypothetical protein